MTRPVHGLLAAIAWLLHSLAPADAAEDRPVLSFQSENDLYGDGKDRWYSNGFRLAAAYPLAIAPDRFDFVSGLLPSAPAPERTDVFIALGQTIFTPEDITIDRLIEDDRPFAGWLYAEIGASGGAGAMQETLTLSLGVTGPPSLAKRTQKFVHEWTNSPDPKGWEFQVGTEPTVQVYYERAWFLDIADLGNDTGIDLSPRGGANLGTVFIDANGGLVLRLGNHLPHALPPRINPSATGAGKILRPRDGGIGWFLFGGIEARAVARNMFLDGALFSSDHSVAKKELVREVSIGFALSYHRFALSYTYVHRSREFELQREGQGFGSVNLSIAL